MQDTRRRELTHDWVESDITKIPLVEMQDTRRRELTHSPLPCLVA